MTLSIFTLGCKVNQYESAALSAIFAERGFTVVKDGNADVIIVNSCTVTDTGDKKTRQLVRKLRRNSPDAVIVLTGCFPQAFPDRAAEITEADIITGTADRSRIPQLVEEYINTRTRIVSTLPIGKSFEEITAGGYGGRTRATVKIQDGCDNCCSYCIIPTARGSARSKPLEKIKSEIESLTSSGYSEIVLIGINLSRYGEDIGLNLTDAVRLAGSMTDRLRLGSLEPDMLITPSSCGDFGDFIERISEVDSLCPQFHLSLQSGCDHTLRRMNRRYTADQYMRLAEEFRRRFENAAITTDVMTGFPGETEEEFAHSIEFVKRVGFAKIHIFPYSAREGTAAAEFDDQIPIGIREQRAKQMAEVADLSRIAFLQSQIGTMASVLFESGNEGRYTGYTDNYMPITVDSDRDIRKHILKAEIVGIDRDRLLGRLMV
ncbi:MAG: tRNA (N(6)-L-threonylcarbamoyladenosine(37)-C(2))-methylthiotransferase MtaB [Oscillospiraceae bacterium]|nr:tRNA (N(6)-L-threonylcarbamoyladenosine(37)-C(2))-methylthiotransferase MtaB [Oscillospiraceae bacterium]